jgi:hypothetical protein
MDVIGESAEEAVFAYEEQWEKLDDMANNWESEEEEESDEFYYQSDDDAEPPAVNRASSDYIDIESLFVDL